MLRTIAALSLVTAAVTGSVTAASAVVHIPIAIGDVTGAPPPQARVLCPATLTFSAAVSTKPLGQRPSTEIRYTWVRSDGTATPTKTVVLTGTDPVTLHDAWLVDHTIVQGSDKLVTGFPYTGSATSALFDVACHKKAP